MLKETLRKQVTTLAAFLIIPEMFQLLNIYGNIVTKSQFLQNHRQEVYLTTVFSARPVREFVLSPAWHQMQVSDQIHASYKFRWGHNLTLKGPELQPLDSVSWLSWTVHISDLLLLLYARLIYHNCNLSSVLQWPCGPRPLESWDREFESRWGRGCSSFVFIV